MTAPYYAEASVTLYHGDMREVVPTLHLTADCIVADPPYGETSLPWDRWPGGWPAVAAGASRSMWCFGSMRMFLDRRHDFGLWRLSQDVVWQKHKGSGATSDRFQRMHEHATHWYRGPWSEIRHETPRVAATPQQIARNGSAIRTARPVQYGDGPVKQWTENGTRLAGSVIFARSMRGRALHATEKPPGVLTSLIEYACPPGGAVLDPFAGSGSTAVAARLIGRRAVLIEADERYCEVIARRLAQDVLPIEPDGRAS